MPTGDPLQVYRKHTRLLTHRTERQRDSGPGRALPQRWAGVADCNHYRGKALWSRLQEKAKGAWEQAAVEPSRPPALRMGRNQLLGRSPPGPLPPTPPPPRHSPASWLGGCGWDHETQGHVGGLLRTLEKGGFSWLCSISLSNQSVRGAGPDMTFFF